MTFGTILVTKDRNECLEKTLLSIAGTTLATRPLVILNNGSTTDDPHDVLTTLKINAPVETLSVNTGIVGARLNAHRIASRRSWTRYLYLQDDFELRLKDDWLCPCLQFMDLHSIGYLRLTHREEYLDTTDHWVKRALRYASSDARWNCTTIQLPIEHFVLGHRFWITDKHYSDWPHIVDLATSRQVIEHTNFCGPSVTELLVAHHDTAALEGAVCCELDYAVKYWIAYALGIVSAVGVLHSDACRFGVFEHQSTESASDYRSLPEDLALLQSS